MLFKILIVTFFIGVCIGTYNHIKERQPTNNNYITLDLEKWEDAPETIPYYIDEQITAIYNQLAAYHNMIDIYRETANYTNDINKKAMYNKRIADLEYKCSKLEEKVYKLLEKWEE